MTIWFHSGKWLYLVRIRYHQPAQILEKSPGSRLPGAVMTTMSNEIGQITAINDLECRCVPIRWLRTTIVILVGHVNRVTYITSPPSMSKFWTKRPLGPIIDNLEQLLPVQTSVQALEIKFGYVVRRWCGSMLEFVHYYVERCGIVPFGGSTLSCWKFEFTSMRVNWE